jgi:hypothetical protein
MKSSSDSTPMKPMKSKTPEPAELEEKIRRVLTNSTSNAGTRTETPWTNGDDQGSVMHK